MARDPALAYEEGKSFRQEEELKRLEKYLSLPRFKKEAARARRMSLVQRKNEKRQVAFVDDEHRNSRPCLGFHTGLDKTV
jgi:hypothetical protein